MTDIRIQGGEGAALAARILRRMGDKELRKELYSGLSRATKPLRDDARTTARLYLPYRGGLAERVARSRLSTRLRTSRGNPGITIAATGMAQLDMMDDGRVRHPVFGSGAWVEQEIIPGWFSTPMTQGADDVIREIDAVVDRVAIEVGRKIQRGKYL